MLICMECDEKRRPVSMAHLSIHSHTVRHRMLWIRTSQAVSARRPTPQTEVAKLDKRLEDVEGRLQEQLERRLTAIEGRMTSVEERVRRIESGMNEKMDRVIGLLQQLLVAGETSIALAH